MVHIGADAIVRAGSAGEAGDVSAETSPSTTSARPPGHRAGPVRCHVEDGPAVPSQPSRRLGPGNRHVSETLSPGSVSAIMSFPGRPQVSALCRCWRSWRRRLGGRPAGQRVDLLPLLPRRDRPVATRAAGPASEGRSCNCIGDAGRTVRGGGALPAAQLRCLGVTHEMLVAPAEQVWDDPVFRSHRDRSSAADSRLKQQSASRLAGAALVAEQKSAPIAAASFCDSCKRARGRLPRWLPFAGGGSARHRRSLCELAVAR